MSMDKNDSAQENFKGWKIFSLMHNFFKTQIYGLRNKTSNERIKINDSQKSIFNNIKSNFFVNLHSLIPVQISNMIPRSRPAKKKPVLPPEMEQTFLLNFKKAHAQPAGQQKHQERLVGSVAGLVSAWLVSRVYWNL